jgi:ATP-dependent exoDNAse (exonuclease V) alpha subunit
MTPWALDRAKLWNAAELAEKRKDARVAREIEISLPADLKADERLVAVQEFAHHLANRYGVAVDIAIHAPHGQMDERNHHAHLLLTTRMVTPEGLTAKSDIERDNTWLLNRNLPTSMMQMKEVRHAWAEIANQRLT